VGVTGDISSDDYFLLAKYYLQVLAGATNQEVVVDPEGVLQPGQGLTVPVSLAETDAGADLMVLSPAPGVLKLELVTPAGDVLRPGALPPGVRFVQGAGVAFFRFDLSVLGAGGRPAWAGQWRLNVHNDKAAFARWLAELEKAKDTAAYTFAARHGLRWSVVAQARSSLRFTAGVRQKDMRPGARAHLRAELAEFGLPVAQRAQVRAEVRDPQGGAQVLPMVETAPGRFEAELALAVDGAHQLRILAEGKTFRGSRFTREALASAFGYVVRPPVDPPAPKDEGGGKGDAACPARLGALLEVIRRDPRLGSLIEDALAAYRVSLADALDCLAAHAGPPPAKPRGPIKGLHDASLIGWLLKEWQAGRGRLDATSGATSGAATPAADAAALAAALRSLALALDSA
jgi:hypothetical protein